MARRIRPADVERLADDVLGGGGPSATDLHAEITRLREAMARAGAELTGAATAAAVTGPSATPPGSRERLYSLGTNALRKGTRTSLQIGLASLVPLALHAANTAHGSAGPLIALAMTPAITFGQNYLEDRNLVRPLLRNPPA